MGKRDHWDLLRMWTAQTKELFSKPSAQVLDSVRTKYKRAVQFVGLWRLIEVMPGRVFSLQEQIAMQLDAQR